MNGVYVDPAAVTKSAEDVADIAQFCGTDQANGDMELPGKNRDELDASLVGTKLSEALREVDSVWAKKCRKLGGAFDDYRGNLVYYSAELQGQDSANANGIDEGNRSIPDWFDDVPNESENEKGN